MGIEELLARGRANIAEACLLREGVEVPDARRRDGRVDQADAGGGAIRGETAGEDSTGDTAELVGGPGSGR